MFIYKYRPTIEHVQLFKPASLGPYDMIMPVECGVKKLQ